MFYATGDIHGYCQDLVDRLDGHIDSFGGDDVLFCLGDVGIAYGYSRSPALLHVMSEFPGKVVVMRGNHDARYERDLLSGALGSGAAHMDEWCGGKVVVDPEIPNVLYIPDGGGVYEVGRDARRVLVIPGAYSVDKDYRLATGAPYEPEEQLTYAECDAVIGWSESCGVEYVMSHTCPFSWLDRLSDLFLPGLDQSGVNKSMERLLDVVYDNVRETCRMWLFGHYHDDRAIEGTPGVMLYNELVAVPELG